MLKIQGLAVIAIVILLPITLVLGQYISAQAKTLSYQIDYDNKLNNSTYDAVKAFQMNTANSDTSDIANSKIRDVKAGANTFFNSLANNFNMSGASKETLSQFVPAVVFTMYDGYYIYAPYTNRLQESDVDDGGLDDDAKNAGVKYYEGQKLSGLKPYVYYSCRYKTTNLDVVITYSLDNYIVIHGTNSSR